MAWPELVQSPLGAAASGRERTGERLWGEREGAGERERVEGGRNLDRDCGRDRGVGGVGTGAGR